MAKRPSSADIVPGPGFRIRSDIERLPENIVKQFSLFDSNDVSDLLNRLYAMSPKIQNMINQESLVGLACTVRVYPGDNLMVHKALDIAKPGDIIVVDSSGCNTTAVLGDLVAMKAKHRGIAGFVVDGMIRDLPGIQDIGIPVYAVGVTPVGPLHRGPGEVNFPICCGGVVVNPGDIILGDRTGVVVIPRSFASETLERAYQHREQLKHYVNDVKQGKFSNDWVDAVLDEKGCMRTDT